MTVIAASLFLGALALSCLSIVYCVMGKWDRIVDIALTRGAPIERTIRLGEQRYTGARLRVVADNSGVFDTAMRQVEMQQAA